MVRHMRQTMTRPAKRLRRNDAKTTERILSHSELSFTGLKKNDAPLVPQGIMGAKEVVHSSNKWDLVSNPQWLKSQATDYKRRVYRDTSNSIQDILQKSFNHTSVGVVAVLALGMVLVNLKEHWRILHTETGERAFGDRRAKIRILKSYNLSEYLFDHHPEQAQLLLSFLKNHIERTEKLMRETAKEFGIEIPIQAQFTFFDENDSFEEKLHKFMGEKV
jgi:hypothetical protein